MEQPIANTVTKFSTTNAIGDFVREMIPNESLAWIVNGTISAIAILVIFVFISAPLLIYMERKVCGHMQARLGPMRVGPHGIFQTIADVIKLLLKEITKPGSVDTFVYFLAPLLPLSASFLILAIIPFDHNLQVADPKLGVIYVIAVSGIGVIGALIGAWASNSKYSLIGAMRAGAQMLAYEISLGLVMLFIMLMAGTGSLSEIVYSQQGTVLDWWIIKVPGLGIIAFILYLISSNAELNRGPFDLIEAEQEITAGFHTEYSGMAFAMFYLAEYVNIVIQGSLVTVFFLGGFLAPTIGIEAIDSITTAIPGFIWFGLKYMIIIFVYMWFRWTFPRPRIDQVLLLEWKIILPANLALLFLGGLFAWQGWIL